MQEESVKNFINTVIFTAKIFSGLKDKFLARKLYDKLSDFVLAYSDKAKGAGSNVAQSGQQDLLVSVNNLLELLDFLEHSKTIAPTPLLYVRRNLLALKLQSIRTVKKPNIIEKEKPSSQAQVEGKGTSSAVPKINLRPELKSKEKETSVGGNKEKIFNYIKRSPNSRTKDIIYEFSILSKRTVKRNLKELVDDGLLKKVAKNKAVYYRA